VAPVVELPAHLGSPLDESTAFDSSLSLDLQGDDSALVRCPALRCPAIRFATPRPRPLFHR